MSILKKAGALLLATALFATSLVGCSSSTSDSTSDSTTDSSSSDSSSSDSSDSTESTYDGEITTIRVWGGVPDESGPVAAIEAFNEEFADQGIQAEYVRFVNDDTGNLQLETALMSGEGVDVFISYDYATLSTRVDAGMVLDVTDYLDESGIDLYEDFGGDIGTAFRIDDRDYGVPTKINLYGMMINADMFEEAGIEIPTEWTLSEFQEICAQLTYGEGQDKVYGAFLNTDQDILSAMTFGSTVIGADWMYKDGTDTETNFDDPVIADVFGTVAEMMNVDESIPTHTDTVTQSLSNESLFFSESCAMITSAWIVRSVMDLENYPHDFTTAFAPYPTSDEGEALFDQGDAGDIVSISAKTENADAAWEYVNWYATEGMTYMATGGRIPLYSGYDLDEITDIFIGEYEDLFDVESLTAVLIEPRDSYTLATVTTASNELTQILKEEVEALFAEQKTVEEALADAKERGDAILAE